MRELGGHLCQRQLLLQKRKLAPAVEADFLPLEGTDYVEFYVGNAKQAAHFYQNALSDSRVSPTRGPETGNQGSRELRDSSEQTHISPNDSASRGNAIADHIAKHGDGVKMIALKVKDATSAWNETTKRGGKSFMNRKRSRTSRKMVMSGIHTYGEVVHVFIERDDYSGVVHARISRNGNRHYRPSETGLQYVDHCVGNVGWNQMNPWVKFYEEVMGFRNILTFDDKDISTEYSALMSKVMSNGNGFVKFPINEPAEGKKKSQVEEYLDFYDGEGVQHVAIATNDIIETDDRDSEARARVFKCAIHVL